MHDFDRFRSDMDGKRRGRMTKREMLVEDLQVMDESMERLASTKQDIWQDHLVWWLCKSVRDILISEIGRMEK